MTLKELRVSKRMSQIEAAEYTGVPLRTYQNYENDANKEKTVKYQYLIKKLAEHGYVDEDHGILDLTDIKQICTEVFEDYEIEYCYLFGSYAMDSARENSDVDLLVSTTVTGLDFYGLLEKLRRRLMKKVDLIVTEQLVDNVELLTEILKNGIKIYG